MKKEQLRVPPGVSPGHRAFLLRASRTYEWHVFMCSLVEEIRQGLQEREAEVKQEIEKLRLARKWARLALEAAEEEGS